MKHTIFYIFLSLVYSAGFSQLSSNLEERLKDHVRILASDSLQGRGLGTEGAVMAREYIIQQFEEAGIHPIGKSYEQEFHFRSGVAWIPGVNIIGFIEGSDPNLKDEYILIGAHYDHIGYDIKNGEKRIFPGADDNASGVAGILEIGRYFVQNPDKLGRSLLIVAFDAEESGLKGSGNFIENSPVPVSKIKMMFSLDMIGMYETNKGLHLKGIGSLTGSTELVNRTAVETGLVVRKTGSNIERRTDTRPFGNQGIPSVHVFTGTKSPYHKPEDKYHLLDFEGMAKITNYMTILLSELSTQEVLLPESSLKPVLAKSETKKTNALSYGLLLNNGRGFHRYEDEFFRARSIYILSTGMYLQLPVNKVLTLQQEVLYDYNGSESKFGRIKRHSVTFPLNLQLGTPRNLVSGIRLYMFGGGWYRYNFAGKEGENSIDFEDIYKKDEWGYSWGIGLDVFRFTMGFTSRIGTTGLTNTMRIKDTKRYFTLGYRF